MAEVSSVKFANMSPKRETNELATETRHSLSNLSLCVFKIARWLKRACRILDRSHVLIRLAVAEKDL